MESSDAKVRTRLVAEIEGRNDDEQSDPVGAEYSSVQLMQRACTRG